jgi:hypothetical protein
MRFSVRNLTYKNKVVCKDGIHLNPAAKVQVLGKRDFLLPCRFKLGFESPLRGAQSLTPGLMPNKCLPPKPNKGGTR